MVHPKSILSYFYFMIVQIPIHLTLPNKLYLSARVDMEPLLVTTKNVFGMFIYGMLEKGSTGRKDIDLSEKYTEVVKLQISEKIFNTRGIHWSNQSNHLFNLFVSELMKDDFHEYMDYHFLLNKVQLRQAIWDWMQRNNLYEDAIALRTLEKDYERYRKRRMDVEIKNIA